MKKLKRSVQSLAHKGLKFVKNPKNRPIVFVVAFGLVGVAVLAIIRAATISISVEPEVGSRTGCATTVSDSSASNGSAVKFCAVASTGTAGAQIPITYNASTLTGTVRYISPQGSDSNSGTSNSPYLTLKKAISASAANDTIVVKGGTYRGQYGVQIAKAGVRIIAESGATPIFNGAQPVTAAWTTEGSYKYISYRPRPATEAQGVHFETLSNMTNLTGDGAGRYPDQVWIGNTRMDQVAAKSSLADGKFYVDPGGKLYLTATDAAKSGIEASIQPDDSGFFIQVMANGITLEGITLHRFSPRAADYGVIRNETSGSNLTVKNVVISDAPFEGIHSGADNLKVLNTTMTNIGWQSINTTQVDNFTLDYAKITNTDPESEFNSSPASGALKTSRNRNATVSNSVISDNKSHGLWFDQSNINTTVANNTITNNSDAGVFFEISDGLTLVNNYIKGGGQPYKAVGSSGLVMVNNTFVGGIDPMGVYTDPRSRPGCSTRTSSTGYCQISTDVQTRFPIPSTMDWMPRIDVMLNNIIAYPTNTQYCQVQAFCITTYHADAGDRPIETIIHKADASRGIPQTVINGNVYANGSGTLIRVSKPAVNYTSLSAWTAAMAASPVSIAGIDANSKAGNSWVNSDGSPTSALSAAHGQAIAVPTNTAINKWIPAGTKHYGVLNK